MPYSQGLSIIPILNRINVIPRIDNYFFKIHFNIVSHQRLPKGLFSIGLRVHCYILKSFLSSSTLST